MPKKNKWGILTILFNKGVLINEMDISIYTFISYTTNGAF